MTKPSRRHIDTAERAIRDHGERLLVPRDCPVHPAECGCSQGSRVTVEQLEDGSGRVVRQAREVVRPEQAREPRGHVSRRGAVSKTRRLAPGTRIPLARRVVEIVLSCMQDERFPKSIADHYPWIISISIGDLDIAFTGSAEVSPGKHRALVCALVDIWRSDQGKVFSAIVEPFELTSFKNGDWVAMLELDVAEVLT